MSALPFVQVGNLSFLVGSHFLLRVKATESTNNKDDYDTTFHAPEGWRLRISTATFKHANLPIFGNVPLRFASDENPEYFTLCTLGCDAGSACTYTILGVEVCGKRTVRFRAAGNGGISLCLFGCVVTDKSGDNMVLRPSAAANNVFVSEEINKVHDVLFSWNI